MSTRPVESRRIAVVGGGLAGLAAALRLVDDARAKGVPLEVTLFEAAERLGGAAASVRQEGYLIERGGDSFLTKPPMIELCRRLGLEGELLPTDAAYRGALVLSGGRPRPVPAGFQLMVPTRLLPILKSPILSASGKARLLRERYVPPRRDDAEESLADFAIRRWGLEVFERLIQPLVAGIYTADPEKLGVAATLPRFLEMERRFGSLLKAGWHLRREAARSSEAGSSNESGARYGLFAGPRAGISQILTALGKEISDKATIRLASPVERIIRRDGGWLVVSPDDRLSVDGVILATPAFVSARLLADVDPSLSGLLRGIPYASSAVVATGYRTEAIEHPLDAFGLVIPAIERREVLAVSFASRKFPGRTPAGSILLRTFVGGATQPEQLERSDDELVAMVRRELAQLLGVHGEPETLLVSRFDQAMPQYHLGHLDRIRRIEEAASRLAGLALAGSAYRGVGFPDVVASGQVAGQRVLDGGSAKS